MPTGYKLSDVQKKRIIKMKDESDLSFKEIAYYMNLSSSTIFEIYKEHNDKVKSFERRMKNRKGQPG